MYQEILTRVKAADDAAPNPLRRALTELFINHPAVAPHDACSPATAKMVRYKLANGRSLGHQIDTTPQHLWFAAADPQPASAQRAKLYAAAAGGEGRHSNVNQMPDLRDQAVLRLTVATVEEAERLLNEMLA